MSKKYTVLIAEEQNLFRDMITGFIKEMNDFQVIEQVSNGEEVIDFINKKEILPTICLLDIQLPKIDGIECAKLLKASFPNMKVVLLTAFDEENCIEKVIAAGANGYVSKNASVEQFENSLRFIMNGQFVAPQPFVKDFSSRLKLLQDLEKQGSVKFIRKYLKDGENLSDREIKLIQRINKGWSNRMIAEDLSISEGTVKNYLSNLYRKLNVRSRTELLQILSKSAG